MCSIWFMLTIAKSNRLVWVNWITYSLNATKMVSKYIAQRSKCNRWLRNKCWISWVVCLCSLDIRSWRLSSTICSTMTWARCCLVKVVFLTLIDRSSALSFIIQSSLASVASAAGAVANLASNPINAINLTTQTNNLFTKSFSDQQNRNLNKENLIYAMFRAVKK